MKSKSLDSKPAPINRVILEQDVIERIDRWVNEVTSKIEHINLRRMDLVNWLIRSRAESLTPREQLRLAETYYNELEFASWAHKKMREERAKGNSITLEDLLRERNEALSRAFKVNSDGEKPPAKKAKSPSENSPELDANLSVISSKS